MYTNKHTNFSGQHLLHNKRLIHEIIELAKIQPKDIIVDIGAGKGAITLPAAEKAKKVIAFEYDLIMAEKLKQKISEKSNIVIVRNDILKGVLPREPYCVVANIPFSITTPILEKILDQPTQAFQRAVLIVEKGSAIRFTSDPITNPRILKWRMWFDMKMVREVSRNYFSPPPRVDGAVLTIRRKSISLVENQYHSLFMALAEYGLRQPRLSVCEALRGVFTPTQLKHVVKQVKIDRNAPICSLNERQWAMVFNGMVHYVERYRWPRMHRK